MTPLVVQSNVAEMMWVHVCRTHELQLACTYYVCVLMIDQLAIMVFHLNKSKGCVDTACTIA